MIMGLRLNSATKFLSKGSEGGGRQVGGRGAGLQVNHCPRYRKAGTNSFGQGCQLSDSASSINDDIVFKMLSLVKIRGVPLLINTTLCKSTTVNICSARMVTSALHIKRQGCNENLAVFSDRGAQICHAESH